MLQLVLKLCLWAAVANGCPELCANKCGPITVSEALNLIGASASNPLTYISARCTSACSEEERARVAYGSTTTYIAYMIAAEVSNDVIFSAQLLQGSITSMRYYSSSGTQICANGAAFNYKGKTFEDLHKCYLSSIVAKQEWNVDTVTNRSLLFPVGMPSLLTTLSVVIAALALDTRTTGSVVSGPLFIGLRPVFEAMSIEETLIAEYPDASSGSGIWSNGGHRMKTFLEASVPFQRLSTSSTPHPITQSPQTTPVPSPTFVPVPTLRTASKSVTPTTTRSLAYSAFIASQMLLRSVALGILELNANFPGRFSSVQADYARIVNEFTVTSTKNYVCSSRTTGQPSPYLPVSVDEFGAINESFDLRTQLVSLLSLGRLLDDSCLRPYLALRLLQTSVSKCGIVQNGVLVGISQFSGGEIADTELTALTLMGAQFLAKEYRLQDIDGIISNLTSADSVIIADECLISNGQGGSFSPNQPSPSCGGPSISAGLTSVVLMAKSAVNFYKVSVPSPSPAPFTSPSPTAAQDSNSNFMVNVAIGASVGGVALLIAGTFLWKKMLRSRQDVLLQTPTYNLGFY